MKFYLLRCIKSSSVHWNVGDFVIWSFLSDPTHRPSTPHWASASVLSEYDMTRIKGDLEQTVPGLEFEMIALVPES